MTTNTYCKRYNNTSYGKDTARVPSDVDGNKCKMRSPLPPLCLVLSNVSCDPSSVFSFTHVIKMSLSESICLCKDRSTPDGSETGPNLTCDRLSRLVTHCRQGHSGRDLLNLFKSLYGVSD